MTIWIMAGLVVTAAVAVVVAGPIMSRVEQPKYTVARPGVIEVREYAPEVAAETVVQGERRQAIEEGFRRLAGYIFGANKPNAKIAMTAPVEQQAKQKIEMTAPVLQQSDGQQSWTVSFIMPAKWTLETLPEPDDPRVKLVPIPTRKMLAIRFSGIATKAVIEAKTSDLRRYADSHDLKISGEPMLAFYNPPWTLPFLRRNEVLFSLSE